MIKKLLSTLAIIICIGVAIPASAQKVSEGYVNKANTVLLVCDDMVIDIQRTTKTTASIMVFDNLMTRKVLYNAGISIDYISRGRGGVVMDGVAADGDKVSFSVAVKNGVLNVILVTDKSRRYFTPDINYIMFGKNWDLANGGDLKYEDNMGLEQKYLHKWFGKFDSSVIIQ